MQPVSQSVRLTGCWLLAGLVASGFAGAGQPLAPAIGDPDWHIPTASTSTGQPPAHPVRGADQPAALQAALQEYRVLASAGGWPEFADGPTLSLGMRDPRVPGLRDHLRLTGDFDAEMQADPLFFDSALVTAVERYQARHGLPVDGRLDRRTREALNVPASERAAQLAAVLQRWQWLPARFESRYLWVNIAAATLQLIDQDVERLEMRVVVGHPSRPTPSLRAEVSGIVLNPAWVVPLTIAREDLLPRQQQDADYLRRKQIIIYDGWQTDARPIEPASIDWLAISGDGFPYRLVQRPGPGNSLGRLKLVMNNEHDIYLHDTNTHYLFDLSVRAFSSGCVRLEDAIGLAGMLLEADGNELSERLARGTTQYLALDAPIPVYLVYLTAWVDAGGTTHFRRDIYGRDRRLAAILQSANY